MRRLLSFLDTPAGRTARYLFSALLIAGFAAAVDWTKLATVRGEFDIPLALCATLAAGLAFPLQAWRWWLLLRAQGLALSFHWTHLVTWIGNFYNAFLLGGLGGDAARAFYLCRDEPARKAAGLAATFFDRVLGLVVLLSLGAVTLLLKLEAVARHTELRLLLALCAVLTLAAGVAGIFLFRQPPAWLARLLGPERSATLTAILHRAGTARGTLLLALLSSYAVWLVDFLSVWLLARAAGLPLPFIEVSLAMSAAYAATVLPVSVGGHGVREGTMIGMFALLGLLPTADSRQHALLIGVLVWAISVLWSLFGGAILLFARRLLPRAPVPETA